MNESEWAALLIRFDESPEGRRLKMVADLGADLRADLTVVTVAAALAVRRGNDYARELNAADGGNRPTFATAQAWLDHLFLTRQVQRPMGSDGQPC